ncbi:class I SAM-dependent methyltransferase [Haladaptatus halobius]|uniref:class I SAM-dependent methyltransferase n=1 Tax=Haladaptatus halobius TaxID=2884875 RepID=UPI001D0B0C4D|nr:class I SAM-dependent methyltransferase [Haladaptatus halobius]
MVDKDTVRRSYDDLAETYAAERSEAGRGKDILDHFLRLLPKSASVLDAGCGQGTPVLRQLNASAIAAGLDFSRSQLDLATENAPHASLIQGDMTNLPVQDGMFDAITAYHSLIHIPLEEHQAVINEFVRVLRPNGRLLLAERPDEWSGSNSDWLGTGVEMQWNIAGAEATREQLRNAGLIIVDEWEITETFAGDDEQVVFFSTQLDT